MYLAMPRDTRELDGWDDHPLVSDGEPSAALLSNDMFKSDSHGSLAFSTGAKLVPLQSATIPDFTTYYDASLMNPKVLVGVFLGAMSTFVFCALTMKAVGRAAKGMVEEVRRQFREKPGYHAGYRTARLHQTRRN